MSAAFGYCMIACLGLSALLLIAGAAWSACEAVLATESDHGLHLMLAALAVDAVGAAFLILTAVASSLGF